MRWLRGLKDQTAEQESDRNRGAAAHVSTCINRGSLGRLRRGRKLGLGLGRNLELVLALLFDLGT